MNLEFIELQLDWSSELSVFGLKNYILSCLRNYGEPLRWAITSLTSHSGQATQRIYIEAVVIMNGDKKKDIYIDLN